MRVEVLVNQIHAAEQIHALQEFMNRQVGAEVVVFVEQKGSVCNVWHKFQVVRGKNQSFGMGIAAGF